MAARLELPVPLDSLLTVQQVSVSVVESVNSKALAATLEWIVDQLNALRAQQCTSDAQAAVAEAPADVLSRLASLEARQDELAQKVEEHASPPRSPDGGGHTEDATHAEESRSADGKDAHLLARLDDLQARVVQLEAQQNLARPATPGAGDHDIQGTAGQGDRDVTDALSQRIKALESRLNSLSAQTSARPTSATASGPTETPTVPSTDTLQDLMSKIDSKADREDIDSLGRSLEALSQEVQALLARGGMGRRLTNDATDKDGAGQDALIGRVFDLETSVLDLGGALKQLQDTLNDQQAALQQHQDQIAGLEASLASKADQGALDKAIALATVGAAGGADPEKLTSMLTDLLSDKATKGELGLLERKVDTKASENSLARVADLAEQALARADQALEKAALAADASTALTDAAAAAAAAAAVPAAPVLRTAQSVGADAARWQQVESLMQQVGDMLADLADLRSQLDAQAATVNAIVERAPVAAAAAATATAAATAPAPAAADTPDAAAAAAAGEDAAAASAAARAAAAAAAANARDLAALRDALDWVAHSCCVMAVGLAPPQVTPRTGQHDQASADLVGGKEPQNPKGAVNRLIKLLGRQSVQHKMDWFDPDTLNALAQKLGIVERFMDNPHLMSGGPGASSGLNQHALQQLKDLEGHIRRLSRDMRSLKDTQQGQSTVPGARVPNSDHAMLSGKPLMGFRCMACDRPLEKLHERPAPHIPTAQMPVRLPSVPDVVQQKAAIMKAPVVGVGTITPEGSAMSVGGKLVKKSGYNPSQRGPGTWYEGNDQKPIAAEVLPAADVGPKLPPGGWRGSVTGSRPSTSPVLELPVVTKRTTPPPATQRPSILDTPVEDHVELHLKSLPSL